MKYICVFIRLLLVLVTSLYNKFGSISFEKSLPYSPELILFVSFEFMKSLYYINISLSPSPSPPHTHLKRREHELAWNLTVESNYLDLSFSCAT